MVQCQLHAWILSRRAKLSSNYQILRGSCSCAYFTVEKMIIAAQQNAPIRYSLSFLEQYVCNIQSKLELIAKLLLWVPFRSKIDFRFKMIDLSPEIAQIKNELLGWLYNMKRYLSVKFQKKISAIQLLRVITVEKY